MAYDGLILGLLAGWLVGLEFEGRADDVRGRTNAGHHGRLGLDGKRADKGQLGGDAFLSEGNKGSPRGVITGHSLAGKLKEQDSTSSLISIILCRRDASSGKAKNHLRNNGLRRSS
jgi:hypothetical protein